MKPPIMLEPAATLLRRPWVRLAIALLLAAGLYAVGRATGLLGTDLATLRRQVEAAGAFGFVVFVLLFALGSLLQVPGMLFVATGVLVFGPSLGYFASFTGAFAAVCATFLLARFVGGGAFARIKRPWVQRMLERIERQPVRWLVALRLVMFISPPLCAALALTRMRFRDYVIGSGIGLVVPILVLTCAVGRLSEHPVVQSLLF